MSRKKKPQGFKKFDALARKLVQAKYIVTFFYTVTFRRQRYVEGSLVYDDWKMKTHAIRAASDHEARRRLLDEYLERGCQVKEIAAELAEA